MVVALCFETSRMSETNAGNTQGNEWLKPVDPNEGERKWAQYAAATTPPRRTTSAATTPQSGSSIERLPPGNETGASTPPPPPPATAPQLFAQIEGVLVPVALGVDGAIVPLQLPSKEGKIPSPPFEFDSDCDESKSAPLAEQTWTRSATTWATQLPTGFSGSSMGFEAKNAWMMLQQQQQLLFQLQQQQAITTAALAGIAARTNVAHDLMMPSPSLPRDMGDSPSAFVSQSDSGLSGLGSSTVTPTAIANERLPRVSRQDALLQQLRSTTITLPPPPPPPAPEKPFSNSKKKSKLEALMNSLHYTDLLTPSYSTKGLTQSETGVVLETPDDDVTPLSSSNATPSNFTPGYKKKACRAYFSSTGCKHAEKCLFSHLSPADA